MKKLLLTSASVAALFAAPAMAQNNTSDVDQQGVGQEAVVAQTGSDSDVTLDQLGFDNLADIEQSGVNNSATVVQAGSDVAPAGAGSATSDFNDPENSNSLDLDQVGNNNTATVDQTGEIRRATCREQAYK